MTFLRAAALLAWLAPAAAAAESTLAWDDCVALASVRNPDLRSAGFARQAGRSGYLGSYNGLMPTLNLTNTYSDNNLMAAGSSHWGAGATLGMNLFSMGQIAAVRSASAVSDRASAQLRQASADLRLNLRDAFLSLLFAQENVVVGRRILELRARGAEMVSLRYDSGRESKGNMMRAVAQRYQAEQDLEQAGRDLRTARRALGRYLGDEDFHAYVASGALEAVSAPELPRDFEAILVRRPDVEAQRAVVGGAEASLLSARSPLFPTLTAQYARNASGNAEFPSSAHGWSAFGTLSLPVFGGGPTATYFASAAAKQTLEKTLEDLRIVRGNALIDVENSWSSYARATSLALVQASLLEAARQRNDEADVRYASGLLVYDNWEIIASDRISQERSALQSRLSAATSEAAWRHALGRGLNE